MENLNYNSDHKLKARSVYDIHQGSTSFITLAKGFPELKQKGERHWFQYHAKGEEEFKLKVVEFHHQKTKFNSYFSVNSFSRPQRSTITLFRLNALYVDIDWHGEQIDYRIVLRVLEEHFFGTKVPYPTHIIFSGRGIQLFWQIEHAPRQALKFWMMIEQLMVEQLDSISDFLPKVKIDHSCTTVDQVMRQAETWHVGAKTYAKELDLDYLHPYQYTLTEITDNYFYEVWEVFDKNRSKAIEKQKRREEFEKNKKLKKENPELYKEKKTEEKVAKSEKRKSITQMFNGYTLMLARLDDFKKLLELRDYDITGCRDTFFFYYAWTFATEYTNLHAITSELLGINSLLKNPLPEAEIEAKAAEVFERLPRVKAKLYSKPTEEELENLTKNKSSKVFKGFRSTTVIKGLTITRIEMKDMKTFIDKREKYDRNNERRRNERRDENGELISRLPVKERRVKVKELIDQGLGYKRIAKALGISEDTAKNDVRALKK